jgi:hypothetical protein
VAARSGFGAGHRGRVIGSVVERWREAKRRTYERQGIEELQGHPRLGMDRAARPRSPRND